MIDDHGSTGKVNAQLTPQSRRQVWLGFAAFLAVALIIVASLSVWQISTSMQNLQQQGTVNGLNRQSAMSTMLQGLSRLLVGLDGIRVDPSSARLSQTAEALDLARKSVKNYSANYLNSESDIVREQILEIDNIIVGTSRLLLENDPPPGDVLSLRTQLGDTVKDLTDEYLHSNEILLQELNGEVQQISRLRERLFAMVLFIGVALVGIVLLAVAQARSRAREAAALDALGERERRYRDLIDGSLQGIIILDGDKPLLANQASARIFGYENPEQILKLDSFYIIIAPEDRGKVLQYRKIMEANPAGSFDDEFLGVRSGGSKFWCNIHFREVFWDGRKVTQVFLIDVTDRRAAAEALERARDVADSASRSKSEFLANMSHEIRTPMNAVIGLSHLALKIAKDATLRDYLNKIDTSARLLLGIINDILDFSKIEAGKLEIESVNFELNQIIDNLIVLFAASVEAKNLELIIKIPADLPKTYIGDPLRLSQVLINLVSNAIKFTEIGHILVTVESGIVRDDVMMLEFTVQDSGIGLSIEQKKRLFQAFSQGDGSTMRRYGGTGLGLTICRRLVELMGGNIGVESELGAGSVFHFSVRLGRVMEQVPLDLHILSKKRVLIIDPNRYVSDSMTEALGDFACETMVMKKFEIDRINLEVKKNCDFIIVGDNKNNHKLDDVIFQLKQNQYCKNAKFIVLVSPSMESNLLRQLLPIQNCATLSKPLNTGKLIVSMVSLLTNDYPVAVQRVTHADETRDLIGTQILLVEDNEINQMVAEGILSAKGVRITIANNGLEAIELLKQKQFDAVLMDLQMPEMDGYTATRIIRQDLDLTDLPIIAMTAHALAEERERCVAAGMDDHVAKPVDPEKLIAVLSKYIVSDRIKKHEKHDNTVNISNKLLKKKHIPGIDMDEALFRIGNNYELLSQLIGKFKEEYADIHVKIQDLINKKDFNEVKKCVHSLKGVAANLSAHTVFETVRLVEAILPNMGDAETIAPLLATLKQAIDEVGYKAKLPEPALVGLIRARDTLAKLVEAAGLCETNLARDLRALAVELPPGPWLAPVEQAARAADLFDYDTAALSIRVAIRLLDSTSQHERAV